MGPDDSGSVVVEFGVVFPLIALLIGGIIAFGYAYGVQLTINQAAREGVRAAALATGDAEAVARGAAVGLDAGRLEVEQLGSCDLDDPSSWHQQVEIILTYDVEFTFPLVFDPVTRLQAGAVMRCGG